MKVKRVFLTVLDSFGCGQCPDSERFGDQGADTLASVASSTFFDCENLQKLGLGNIDGITCLKKENNPIGLFGKAKELSNGKDTTVGHWEIAGFISDKGLPTYPNGFPSEVIDKIEEAFGTKILCNKPYSGTMVINEYGDEHVTTGFPIVYTSADSVFQIACHEDVVPLERLYELCRIARKILCGSHSVGRVIARPFKGESGNYYRTPNRHDYSLEPGANTLLDYMKNDGFDVISIGKIDDIFAHRGITKAIASSSNTIGMQKMSEIQKEDFTGICFTNLVDFDMVYGHRRDIDGYAKAISEFDSFLGGFCDSLREDDLLIITADHGCDPGFIKTTDHTREFVPVIVYSKSIKPCNLGTLDSYSDIAATIAELFNKNYDIHGKSFAKLI